MLLRTSLAILALSAVCFGGQTTKEAPSQGGLSAECLVSLQELGKNPSVDAITTALGKMWGGHDTKALIQERVNAVVTRVKNSGATQQEATRLVAGLTSKLLSDWDRAESPTIKESYADRALTLINGVNSATDITDILSALRKGREGGDTIFDRLENQAAARQRELIRKAQEEADAIRTKQIAEADAQHELASLEWIDGKELKLPAMPKFSPSLQYDEFDMKRRGIQFEVESLKWIANKKERFYAVGSTQMAKLEPHYDPLKVLDNADAVSVSKVKKKEKGKEIEFQAINIREFKTDPMKLGKACQQIEMTLRMILIHNPKARIGTLEVLIPEDMDTDRRTGVAWVDGQPHQIVFTRLKETKK